MVAHLSAIGKNAVAFLEEFLKNKGEKLIDDPLKPYRFGFRAKQRWAPTRAYGDGKFIPA
jgi:hypothetical protein